MSRTSRRTSRLLIGLLAAVIAVGGFLTIRKLHGPRSAQARPTPLATPAAPAPVAAVVPPAAPVVAPAPKPPAPATRPAAPDALALVTQTPTEKVSQDPMPASPALAPAPSTSDASLSPTSPIGSAPAAAPEAPPTPEQKAAEVASLENWAHSAKPAADPGPTAVQPAPLAGPVSAQPLVDAKAKADAGDLLSARQILNTALIAGGSTDADALKKQIEEINQTVIFSPRKFPNDPWGGVYQVASGERLASIANRNQVTWEFLSRINNVSPRRLRAGQTIKTIKGPFYAVVTKHRFKMDVYLGAPGGPGSMFVRTFDVGLGKDNSTPTGMWVCKAGDKIRSPKYYPPRGGEVIAADDPKNPLGGYWIAIEGLDGQAVGKESYGIHGTIDPDSIGKMESMGCIRLRHADIDWVFDLLVDGKSKVKVLD